MGSRARGGGSAGWKPTPEVKVKHIIPRKVSTDEASFKDVVQRLTGKDSAAARVELLGARDGSSVVAPTTMAPVLAGGGSGRSDVGMEGGGGGAGFNMGLRFPSTTRAPVFGGDGLLVGLQ